MRWFLLSLYVMVVVASQWGGFMILLVLSSVYLGILGLVIFLNWAWNFDWLKWMEK